MTRDFNLPVERLPVALILADGTRRDAVVFVPAGQRVEELLESALWFLPADEAGTFRLYAREGLAAIGVDRARLKGGDPFDGLPHERRRTVVRLRSGTMLFGELRYLAPPQRRRTADFVNEEPATFALHGPDVVYHVVKAHVAYLEEA
jgi:hypothetical protein